MENMLVFRRKLFFLLVEFSKTKIFLSVFQYFDVPVVCFLTQCCLCMFFLEFSVVMIFWLLFLLVLWKTKQLEHGSDSLDSNFSSKLGGLISLSTETNL